MERMHENTIEAKRTVTIAKPREEVYRFWRDIENLPKIMDHLESVKVLSWDRSHWVARGPAGRQLHWDAVLTNEQVDERLDWEAVRGSAMVCCGSVVFRDAPAGKGTEVQVSFRYNPPMGSVGATFAKLFQENPSQVLREDLRRFKRILETGEIPTVMGQPAGPAYRTTAEEVTA
jgi:uncharacterized membrane protein